MKFMPLMAAAGFAAAALAPVSAADARTVVAVGVGAPAGPGWYGYHERVYRTGWDGPRYYGEPGPHHGWYNYNNNYYQNCSYRWTRHHRSREWRCW
jgi:hypothetical protein